MTTKYEIDTRQFTDNMFNCLGHENDAWGTIDRLQDYVEKALISQDLRFDNVQNCTNVYTFLGSPLTILVPPDADRDCDPYDEEDQKLWGVTPEAALGVAQFGPEFGVTRPFTVWGWWSDENGAGGFFGFEKGRTDPTILFC